MKKKGKIVEKIISLFLIVVIAVGAFAGCGGKSSSGEELPTLKVGIIPSGAIRPALVVAAYALGYYEEEGVNVKIENLSDPSQAYAAIDANKLDIYPYTVNGPTSLIAQGSDVVIIAGTASEGSSLVKGDGNEDVDFRDFNNWIGKKIQYTKGDEKELLLKKYISEQGVDIDEIEWVQIDDEDATLEALKKGKVDAGFLTEEKKIVAEKAGLQEGFQVAEFLPNYVCCRQTANGTRVKENRDAYVKYIKAQTRALHDFLDENTRKTVIQAIADYIDQDYDYVESYIATPQIVDTGNVVAFKNPVSPDPLYNNVKAFYDANVEAGYFEPAQNVSLKEHVLIDIYEDGLQELIDENPDDEIYPKLLKYFKEQNSEWEGDK